MTDNKTSTSKRLLIPQLIVLSIFFFVVFVTLYWLIYVHPYVSTQDAYIEGRQSLVSPGVEGKITEGGVKEGDKVSKGDLLFKLDDQLLQSEKKQVAERVIALEEHLNYLKENTDLRMNLYLESRKNGEKRSDVEKSLKNLDDVKVAFEKTKSSISLEKLKLEHLEQRIAKNTIEAPFDGVITKCHYYSGSFVEKNDKVLCIYNSKEIYAYAHVLEGDIHKVKIGSNVKLNLQAYPNLSLTGKVDFISPSVKKIGKRKFIPIKISVDTNLLDKETTKNIHLGHGMTAEVKIETK